MKTPLFSIIVLTFNRHTALVELLDQLKLLRRFPTEIVVVNNGSADGTAALVRKNYPSFVLVENRVNLGAVGRNEGMRIARGTYLITLDDDIYGLKDDHLAILRKHFAQNYRVGAICFQVRDHFKGTLCNWCHPCRPEEGAEQILQTTEISEGAVAFRRSLLLETGLYTREFFISHEGADLAARILDRGFDIVYLPQVRVTHKYALEGRPGWRRYYYDTRNDFWLVVRNYRWPYLLAHLGRRLPATFVYALRDGFLLYWLKALSSAFFELPTMLHQRRPISSATHLRMKKINRNRPGFFYLFKRRLFARELKI